MVYTARELEKIIRDFAFRRYDIAYIIAMDCKLSAVTAGAPEFVKR